jgi:hypothetical protein
MSSVYSLSGEMPPALRVIRWSYALQTTIGCSKFDNRAKLACQQRARDRVSFRPTVSNERFESRGAKIGSRDVPQLKLVLEFLLAVTVISLYFGGQLNTIRYSNIFQASSQIREIVASRVSTYPVNYTYNVSS